MPVAGPGGLGGIGKTRLALAAAAQIVLAPLCRWRLLCRAAPVSEAIFIVPAIAETLRFTFHGSRDPKEQLLGYLRERELLLVIDNFEHLLDGANFLSEILGHAPNVHMLVTARERLNLREEWAAMRYKVWPFRQMVTEPQSD